MEMEWLASMSSWNSMLALSELKYPRTTKPHSLTKHTRLKSSKLRMLRSKMLMPNSRLQRRMLRLRLQPQQTKKKRKRIPNKRMWRKMIRRKWRKMIRRKWKRMIKMMSLSKQPWTLMPLQKHNRSLHHLWRPVHPSSMTVSNRWSWLSKLPTVMSTSGTPFSTRRSTSTLLTQWKTISTTEIQTCVSWSIRCLSASSSQTTTCNFISQLIVSVKSPPDFGPLRSQLF